MECVGKQIRAIPLTIIAPPVITPIDMIVGYTITNAAKRDAAQTMTPMVQRPIPTTIFILDLSS
jgi:hypothetical protein